MHVVYSVGFRKLLVLGRHTLYDGTFVELEMYTQKIQPCLSLKLEDYNVNMYLG